MSEPFLAEIKIVGFNFAPRGWAFCDGQILPINQNQSLYSLLGTTYGGDGRTNFALPDLRSRVPIHKSAGHPLGEKGGQETHTLSVPEMPQHTHPFKGTTDAATARNAVGQGFLGKASVAAYRTDGTAVSLNGATINNVGGSQAHENRQPFLGLAFCIALQGLFPSRN
ncbi:MAG: phage tail protein [Planctomycetaceae bacterium]|nr:phage tail protein [Planctomycetaceae bacterium]MCB9951251.1 phage tail protein [Planctomycetaceae bacterium]